METFAESASFMHGLQTAQTKGNGMELHGKLKAFQIREATQEDIDTFKDWAEEQGCKVPEFFARLCAWRRDGDVALPAPPMQSEFANGANSDVERAWMLARTLRELHDLPPKGHAGTLRAWIGQEARALRSRQTSLQTPQTGRANEFANRLEAPEE